MSCRPHTLRLNIAAQDCSTPFTDSGSDKKDEDWLTADLGEGVNGVYQLLYPSPVDEV